MTALEPGHKGWTWPLTWRGARYPLLGAGQPSLIFVADMADLFHEKRRTAIIDRVVDTIVLSPHIGLLLTRRSERMARYFSTPPSHTPPPELRRNRRRRPAAEWRLRQSKMHKRLWLGVSAERQQEFDQHWEHICPLAADGWTVFVSIAPMLGPMTLPGDFLDHGGNVWVICSGEQGEGARPMDPDWARAVRDQCVEAGVPFFMLQMAGRKEIPADLFVRQFPQRVCRPAPLMVPGAGSIGATSNEQ